jgi:RNA polymerase sigma-70 factor (ECF subfamily)
VDPDDVVQSVYRSFFHRHGEGQFEVQDWDGLWTLLTLITVRKCAGRVGYFLAACRSLRREADVAAPPGEADRPNWEPAGDEPTPEEAAVLAETLERVMRGMEKWEAEILTLSLQGYSVPEISQQVCRAERTVERVRERIKARLRRMQEADAGGAA